MVSNSQKRISLTKQSRSLKKNDTERFGRSCATKSTAEEKKDSLKSFIFSYFKLNN